MSAIQSALGMFVQSQFGMRQAGVAPDPGIITAQETLWVVGGTTSAVARTREDCDTSQVVNPFSSGPSIPYVSTVSYTVTNISNSNPAVVTISGTHDLTNKMAVDIRNVNMPGFPGVATSRVNVIDPSTFEAIDIDSSAMGAYVSGGVSDVRDIPILGVYSSVGLQSGTLFDWAINCFPTAPNDFIATLKEVDLVTPHSGGGFMMVTTSLAIHHFYADPGDIPPWITLEKILVKSVVYSPDINAENGSPQNHTDWRITYSEDVLLSFNTGPVEDWTVIAPVGATLVIEANGLSAKVSYDFDVTDINQAIQFDIQASNALGTDNATWTVNVLPTGETPPVINAVADDDAFFEIGVGPFGYQESLTLSAGTATSWEIIQGPSTGTAGVNASGVVTWNGYGQFDPPANWIVRAANGAGFDDVSWTTTIVPF